MSSFSSDSVVISEYITSNQDIPLFVFDTQYYSESFHLEKKYESYNHELIENEIIDETSFSFELGYPDLLVINNTGIIVKIRYVSMNIWEKLTDLSTEVVLYNFPKEVLSDDNLFELIRLNNSIEYNIDEIQFEYSYHSEIYSYGSRIDDNEIGIWYPINNIPTKELIPIPDFNALQETMNLTSHNPEQHKLNRRWSYLSSYFVDKENLSKIDFLEELNEISIELSNKLLEAWNTVFTSHENLGSMIYPLLGHLRWGRSSPDFESNLVLIAPVFILMQIIAIFIYFKIIQQQS